MANNNQSSQSSGNSEQLRKYLSDLGRLIARFLWDLAKMLGKGALLLYRSIGQRRTQIERDADRATRKADNALNDAAQQRQSTAKPRKEPTDEEAASMLEELLQQSRIPPDTSTDEADAEAAVDDTAINAVDGDDALDVPTAIETDIEALEQRVESKVNTQAEPEKDRIHQQLAERRAMLEEEREERQRAFQADEKRKAEREQAVQSDLERIRAEREQRANAFQKAESERRERLSDHPSEGDTDDAADQSDDRQQGSNAR